jgi:hypothetical protein
MRIRMRKRMAELLFFWHFEEVEEVLMVLR